MTSKKIMIVDDDEDDVDFFCEALNDIDSSHDCLTATDGEDALQQLRNTIKEPPDCLFLDINMPKMNGKTCLRKIKSDSVLKTIPVVIYTTSSHIKERDEMLRLGADHFLTKASSFDRLKASIEEVLQIVLPVARPKAEY